MNQCRGLNSSSEMPAVELPEHGSRFWVNRAVLTLNQPLPVYADEWTSSDRQTTLASLKSVICCRKGMLAERPLSGQRNFQDISWV
jgi:hypothetical protein